MNDMDVAQPPGLEGTDHTPPLISIITVVRNAENVVEDTLRSVAQQTFTDYEYLVLDGASTDKTAAIIERHQPAPTYFHSAPDRGIYDAMNRALEIARGEFVYFLNAGDRLYTSDTLERLAPLLRSGCDFFSGRVRIMSEQGVDLQRYYPDPMPSLEQLWRGCCIAHQATFVRRQLLLRLKGFDTSLRSSADYELWLRIRKLDISAELSADTVAWYREGGLSSNRATRSIRDREDAQILLRHGILGPWSAALLKYFRWRPRIRRRLVRWFGQI